ncbi:MAG: hypothetical protein JWO82_559 [Akkermansiaceae bacterium]|nr:hypothetical protein [Akkermansiaceae bacterium]
MKRRPWTLLVILGAAFFLLLGRLGIPWTRLFPACPLHAFTGFDCPGCGGTRCAVKLMHGDLAGALAMNAFVVVFALAAAVWLGAAVWREWQGRPAPRIPPWSAWTLLAVFLIFGVTRNLPWWPFTLLAPH